MQKYFTFDNCAIIHYFYETNKNLLNIWRDNSFIKFIHAIIYTF